MFRRIFQGRTEYTFQDLDAIRVFITSLYTKKNSRAYYEFHWQLVNALGPIVELYSKRYLASPEKAYYDELLSVEHHRIASNTDETTRREAKQAAMTAANAKMPWRKMTRHPRRENVFFSDRPTTENIFLRTNEITRLVKGKSIRIICFGDVSKKPNLDYLQQDFLREVKELTGLTIYKYYNYKKNKDFEVYHFNEMPDYGVITCFTPEVIDVIYRIASDMNGENQYAYLIHCSLGLGRTGWIITFIDALKNFDQCFAKGAELSDSISELTKIVRRLRKARPGMLQSPIQYQQAIEMIFLLKVKECIEILEGRLKDYITAAEHATLINSQGMGEVRMAETTLPIDIKEKLRSLDSQTDSTFMVLSCDEVTAGEESEGCIDAGAVNDSALMDSGLSGNAVDDASETSVVQTFELERKLAYLTKLARKYVEEEPVKRKDSRIRGMVADPTRASNDLTGLIDIVKALADGESMDDIREKDGSVDVTVNPEAAKRIQLLAMFYSLEQFLTQRINVECSYYDLHERNRPAPKPAPRSRDLAEGWTMVGSVKHDRKVKAATGRTPVSMDFSSHAMFPPSPAASDKASTESLVSSITFSHANRQDTGPEDGAIGRSQSDGALIKSAPREVRYSSLPIPVSSTLGSASPPGMFHMDDLGGPATEQGKEAGGSMDSDFAGSVSMSCTHSLSDSDE